MALGKRRRERQLEAFVAASDLPKSPGHPFYTALNRLPAANGFDPVRSGCGVSEEFFGQGCHGGSGFGVAAQPCIGRSEGGARGVGASRQSEQEID